MLVSQSISALRVWIAKSVEQSAHATLTRRASRRSRENRRTDKVWKSENKLKTNSKRGIERKKNNNNNTYDEHGMK